MKRMIPVTVRDRIATKTGDEEYICGNSDFTILFDFDAEWDAWPTKTARFTWAGNYQDVLFEGSECPVPVISDVFHFKVGVYAGNLRTTTAARVPAKKSVLCGSGGMHKPPEEDIYNEILEKVNARPTAEQSAKSIAEAMDKEFFIIRINGGTPSATEEEIDAAAAANRMIFLEDGGHVYTYVGKAISGIDQKTLVPTFVDTIKQENRETRLHSIQYMPDAHKAILCTEIVRAPNPSKLILSGAVTAQYDGSKQVNVEIPTIAGPAGKDGKDGATGPAGADGYSPTITLTRITGGVRIDAQNKSGTQTATVYDGKDGEGGGTGGGGLPTGDGPNMMLVTDSEGNAVWEAKIPTIAGGADIFPEITVNVDEMEDGMMGWTEPLPHEVVIGETYVVNYNGKTYTCTAVAFDMSGGEGAMIAPALGNIGAMIGDESLVTEDPFVFVYIPPAYVEMVGAYAMLVVFEDVYEHTFGIKGAGGVKIDNSALDLDWIAKYDNVGETIVAETIGRGIDVSVPWIDSSFFVEGTAFIAYVDNVRYDLTVINYEGTLAAGNLGLIAAGAPGNGEPFYVCILGSGGLLFSWGIAGDMDASHTVSAYLPGGSQRVANQKVPDAFFPDIRPFYVKVQNNVADKTYDEIHGAYVAGRMVLCRLIYGDEYVLYFDGLRSAAVHFFGSKYKVSIGSDGTVTVQ